VLATCIKCCSSTRDRIGANDSIPWFEIVYAHHFGWLVETKVGQPHNATGTAGLVGEICRTDLSAKAIPAKEMMPTRRLSLLTTLRLPALGGRARFSVDSRCTGERLEHGGSVP